MKSMTGLSYRELSRMVADKRYGPKGTAAVLIEGLQRGDIKPNEIRIRPLFEAIVAEGRDLLSDWGTTGGLSQSAQHLMESGAVKSSDFGNITGQIVSSQVLKYYEDEEYIFSRLVDVMDSPFLSQEKIAGIGRIGDDTEIVPEGQPFPLTGPVEDWIEAPPGQKRGHRVALTWEAIFSDRTGDMLARAGEVGKFLGLNKEKRIIDAMVDENAGAKSAVLGGHRYHWRGTSFATYQTTTPWDNVTASNALSTWTNIEAAELTLSRIRDPNTGEPIMISPDCLVVTKQLEYTARYIITAGALAVNAGGYATSGTPTRFEVPNFLPKYTIYTSRLLETRMATDTDWFLGNVKQAIVYKQNRPLKVEQSPDALTESFVNEIVTQFKASEVGNAFVRDPRLINKSTVA